MVVALDELPYDVLEVVASHVAGHLDDPEERQHNLLLLARCAPAFVAPAQRQLTMHLWLNGFERAARLWLDHLGPNEQPFVESLEVKLRGRSSLGIEPGTLLNVVSRCRGLETLVFGAMREADLAAPHSATLESSGSVVNAGEDEAADSISQSGITSLVVRTPIQLRIVRSITQLCSTSLRSLIIERRHHSNTEIPQFRLLIETPGANLSSLTLTLPDDTLSLLTTAFSSLLGLKVLNLAHCLNLSLFNIQDLVNALPRVTLLVLWLPDFEAYKTRALLLMLHRSAKLKHLEQVGLTRLKHKPREEVLRQDLEARGIEFVVNS